MGSGSSHMKGEEIKGDVLIDCPILVDLNHGTIRHRTPDEKARKDSKITTGYFYHARLDDFSEDAVIPSAESYKLQYVFKGPAKAKGKRLFYVYGNKLNAEDTGIQRGAYKPKGKGFNWPESYRKANNLYYEIIFLPALEEPMDSDHDDDTLSYSTDTLNGSEIQPSNKESFNLWIRKADTIESIKRRISIGLLIPTVNLHIMLKKKELDNDDIVRDIIPDDEDNGKDRLNVNLKLL